MLSPKHGLLNMIVSAFSRGVRKEVLFVPVSISYESVIEAGAYSEENAGKPKAKEKDITQCLLPLKA